MSREILVVTPENIEIEYELAGIGSRFLANLLDSFLQIAIYAGIWIVVGIVAGILTLAASTVARSFGAFFAGTGMAFALIAGFLVLWGYYIYFETVWNGQTPGKRQLGLRVIRDGGYPINIYAAIVRNLLRVMDGMALTVIGAGPV